MFIGKWDVERKISFMRVLVGFIRSMGYLFGSLGYFIIKRH